MPSGGARSRSGPPADPNSKRSEKRGQPAPAVSRVLPREGYKGKPPHWPLPKKPAREIALWKKVWTYPQAAAWIDEPWRWLTIAHYVKWAVRSEDPNASASVMAQVRGLADSIGLSPSGLIMNGWKIEDSIETKEEAEKPKPAAPPVRRLRAVNDKVDN